SGRARGAGPPRPRRGRPTSRRTSGSFEEAWSSSAPPSAVGAGHHALEHPVGAGEGLHLLLHGGGVLAADGLAGAVDDAAGLADGVAAEVARRHDLLDLGEHLLDVGDELLRLLADALE